MTTFSSYIFSLRSKKDIFLHLTNDDRWDQVSLIHKIFCRQIRYLEFDPHLYQKKKKKKKKTTTTTTIGVDVSFHHFNAILPLSLLKLIFQILLFLSII